MMALRPLASSWQWMTCSCSDSKTSSGGVDRAVGRVTSGDLSVREPRGVRLGAAVTHMCEVDLIPERSEERRGGKECVSTCSSRGSQYKEKKKKNNYTTIMN